MAIDQESFNKRLYDLLKTHGYNPVSKNSKNERIPVPQEADVFEFTFTKDGEDYGKVWATINKAKSLEIYYGKEVSGSPPGKTPGKDYDDSWSGLIKQLKQWAGNRLLSFDLKDMSKLNDDMTQREWHNMKERTNEGYHAVNQKTSYNDNIPNVKVVIQHDRAVQEGEQRWRNVHKIFVENTEGERFAVPTRMPGIARVYGRHVAEGGTPYDDRGKHITTLVEEYTQMAGFVRATRNGQFNESVAQLIAEGINHHKALKESLQKMQSHRGYNHYFESWTPPLMEDDSDSSSIAEMFAQETIDPRIESVLPILNRLNSGIINEIEEVNELDQWAKGITEITEAEGDNCEKCNGKGKIDHHSEDGPIKCPDCSGKGKQKWKPEPVNWGKSKVKEDAEERPYICYHTKKGKHECTASSSYGAAQKAADHWGLKSTAGIDAKLADVEHSPASLEEEKRDTHCSAKCCGADVKAEDCGCSPDCPHCNCNKEELDEALKPHVRSEAIAQGQTEAMEVIEWIQDQAHGNTVRMRQLAKERTGKLTIELQKLNQGEGNKRSEYDYIRIKFGQLPELNKLIAGNFEGFKNRNAKDSSKTSAGSLADKERERRQQPNNSSAGMEKGVLGALAGPGAIAGIARAIDPYNRASLNKPKVNNRRMTGLAEEEHDNKGFTDKEIKMAYGIANDPRYKDGNMSGAIKAIESIKKGLSDHPSVEKVLQATQMEETKSGGQTFAGHFKTGPAGQWRNTGKTKGRPAKVGDLVGAESIGDDTYSTGDTVTLRNGSEWTIEVDMTDGTIFATDEDGHDVELDEIIGQIVDHGKPEDRKDHSPDNMPDEIIDEAEMNEMRRLSGLEEAGKPTTNSKHSSERDLKKYDPAHGHTKPEGGNPQACSCITSSGPSTDCAKCQGTGEIITPKRKDKKVDEAENSPDGNVGADDDGANDKYNQDAETVADRKSIQEADELLAIIKGIRI